MGSYRLSAKGIIDRGYGVCRREIEYNTNDQSPSEICCLPAMFQHSFSTICYTATQLTVAVETWPRISLLVQSPRSTACIMHRRPPEIPHMFPFEAAARCSMHDRCVVPVSHISSKLALDKTQRSPNDQVSSRIPSTPT
jgi:hypothetical protein